MHQRQARESNGLEKEQTQKELMCVALFMVFLCVFIGNVHVCAIGGGG